MLLKQVCPDWHLKRVERIFQCIISIKLIYLEYKYFQNDRIKLSNLVQKLVNALLIPVSNHDELDSC